MPALRRRWSVDDLLDLPDNGNRYEVVDGELFVTPAPSWTHQAAALAGLSDKTTEIHQIDAKAPAVHLTIVGRSDSVHVEQAVSTCMPKKRPPRAVREPVQVYLEASDRATLERAALASGLPRAEVLLRGLRRFASELLADESPALAFLDRAATAAQSNAPADVAARHDEYLADWELASWSAAPAAKKVRPGRK